MTRVRVAAAARVGGLLEGQHAGPSPRDDLSEQGRIAVGAPGLRRGLAAIGSRSDPRTRAGRPWASGKPRAAANEHMQLARAQRGRSSVLTVAALTQITGQYKRADFQLVPSTTFGMSHRSPRTRTITEVTWHHHRGSGAGPGAIRPLRAEPVRCGRSTATPPSLKPEARFGSHGGRCR